MNLRKARQDGDIEKFIQEHEKDAPGDLDKLDSALKRPASQKSKATRKASSRDNRGD